jgi:hypothetical protein
MSEMITDNVNVQILDKPEDAPNYDESVTMLKVDKALIVCNGTVSGKPTVDLQMVDADGKKYLVMATGGIMEMLGSSVAGARQRTDGS